MKQKNIVLCVLLLALLGCQQETTSQQSGTTEPAPAPVVEVAEPSTVETEAIAGTVQQAQEGGAAPEVGEKMAQVAEVADNAKEKAIAAVAAPVKATVPESVKAAVAAPKVADADALEVEAMALAKKNNCFICHAINSKVVGPAWKDVAAKYRGDSSAPAHLLNKIAKGGSGVWGAMAMPAHPQISEADRQKLVNFILSLQ